MLFYCQTKVRGAGPTLNLILDKGFRVCWKSHRREGRIKKISSSIFFSPLSRSAISFPSRVGRGCILGFYHKTRGLSMDQNTMPMAIRQTSDNVTMPGQHQTMLAPLWVDALYSLWIFLLARFRGKSHCKLYSTWSLTAWQDEMVYQTTYTTMVLSEIKDIEHKWIIQ